MSRSKYELVFPLTKCNITCKIYISRSFDSKTGFCQGKNGRQVRTVKVLARDDAKPTDRSDIEELVPWETVETYYPYKQVDGTVKLLAIDTSVLKKIYQNSAKMSLISIIPMKSIRPSMYDGSHYFVRVQKAPKTRTIFPEDQKIYTILYHGLLERNHAILVKYISYNREKFAVLYSDPMSSGLMMANIFHSTYQRDFPASQLAKILDPTKYSNVLFNGLIKPDITDDNIADTYETRLNAYIDSIKEFHDTSKTGKFKIGKINIKHIVSTETDILDQIMGMGLGMG